MTDDPDDLDLDEDDDDRPPRSGFAAWVLPFGTSFVALAVGALVGGSIVALFPHKPTLVEVSKDLTNEDIDSLCKPKVDDAVATASTKMEAAEAKVRTLEAQISQKEEEITTLNEKVKKTGAQSHVLKEQLRKAKESLSHLEGKLETALQEKEQLVVDLRKTEVALTDQVQKTSSAKEEGLVYKWRSFVGLAQLTICDKGMRRKLGRCRETVAAALNDDIRHQFEHCLRSGQETPSIVEADRGQTTLPAYASWLDQDDRVTKGWYVRLCDPSLPEATDFAPVDMNQATQDLDAPAADDQN